MENHFSNQKYTVSGFFQWFDSFGTNVALAYDKKYEFKTSIGGLLSIIKHSVMGIIIAVLIRRMVNREDVTIIENVTVKNHELTDGNVYPFENEKFMIGMLASFVAPDQS